MVIRTVASSGATKWMFCRPSKKWRARDNGHRAIGKVSTSMDSEVFARWRNHRRFDRTQAHRFTLPLPFELHSISSLSHFFPFLFIPRSIALFFADKTHTFSSFHFKFYLFLNRSIVVVSICSIVIALQRYITTFSVLSFFLNSLCFTFFIYLFLSFLFSFPFVFPLFCFTFFFFLHHLTVTNR